MRAIAAPALLRGPARSAICVATIVTALVGHAAAFGPAPFTMDDHTDLRPGAPILPDDWLTVGTLHGDTRNLTCTANFVFHDLAGNRYIGTAGHCAPVERGVHAWEHPQGPVALDADWEPIGRFVYAGSTLVPAAIPAPVVGFVPEWDFALIRLDDHVAVDPQMAHFGGPTAINEDLTQAPVVLHMYGWGVHGVNFEDLLGVATAYEQPFHGRTFAAMSMPYPDVVHAFGVGGGGDSGAPIISADGRAVGIISSMNYADHRIGTDGVSTGTGVHVRLAPQLQKAQEMTGLTLVLQTAPLAEAYAN